MRKSRKPKSRRSQFKTRLRGSRFQQRDFTYDTLVELDQEVRGVLDFAYEHEQDESDRAINLLREKLDAEVIAVEPVVQHVQPTQDRTRYRAGKLPIAGGNSKRRARKSMPARTKCEMVKVHELARDCGITAKAMVTALRSLGEWVDGPNSTVPYVVADQARLLLNVEVDEGLPTNA